MARLLAFLIFCIKKGHLFHNSISVMRRAVIMYNTYYDMAQVEGFGYTRRTFFPLSLGKLHLHKKIVS